MEIEDITWPRGEIYINTNIYNAKPFHFNIFFTAKGAMYQACNQDFMWGWGRGGGVLTRPKWTKVPKCIFYCLIRLGK